MFDWALDMPLLDLHVFLHHQHLLVTILKTDTSLTFSWFYFLTVKRFHTLFYYFCFKYWLSFKILEIYTKSLKKNLWQISFFSNAVARGPVTTLLKQYITSSFLCASALFSEDRQGLLSVL